MQGNAIQFAFPHSGRQTKLCDTNNLPVGKWHKVLFAQYKYFRYYYKKLTINGNRLTGRNSCSLAFFNSDRNDKTWENIQVREDMKIKFI